MSRPFQAVIFDSDGTLVDSERLSLSLWFEMAADLGYVVEDVDEAVAKWAGRNLAELGEEVATGLGEPLPDGFMDEFRSRQLTRLAAEVTEIDGAAEVLRHLTTGPDAVPCRVASNAPRLKVETCLNAAGLMEFFESPHIYSAYELDVWKPEPDLFEHVASTLGIAPEGCAVIEDSEAGVQAGVAAGMSVFAYDPAGLFTSTDGVTSMTNLRELIDHLS